MHNIYRCKTPSGETIEIIGYSIFRDILTIGDLKYLFTKTEPMYSMESFDLARLNNVTKQKEVLNTSTKLCDLKVDEYYIIHINIPQTIKVIENVENVEKDTCINVENVEKDTCINVENIENEPCRKTICVIL